MKQTGIDSDALYLPQEIITNILKRLPVKFLMRFQCVCKYWKNLIKNPSFIADHLQQSSHQNPYLLLEVDGGNSPVSWHLLDCGMKVQKEPLIDSWEGARIVGSCNGLLCVEIYQYDKSNSLSLWNPATTAVRHVPTNKTDCLDFDCSATGFGFSPIVNDYKIVRTYSQFNGAVKQVEVFSLSRGSWKGLDIGNLKGVKLFSETATVNEGALFWCGIKLDAEKEGGDNIEVEEGEDGDEVVVSFDIAKEVFTLIPTPDLGYNANEQLAVYENKLVMLCDNWDLDDEMSNLIELWVVEEGTWAFKERWGWSSPYLDTLDPVTIWRNQIVYKPSFELHNDIGRNVLHLMNLTTSEVKRFVIPYCDSIYNLYNYVESLVSVGNNYSEES